MFKRWKVAILSPLLALALLLPTAPLQVHAAVAPCSAGGSVTVTTVTSEGTVTLSVQCTGAQLASSNIPGSASQQNFYPRPPADASWNGSYCAGSATGLVTTYWVPVSAVRTGANPPIWGGYLDTNGGWYGRGYGNGYPVANYVLDEYFLGSSIMPGSTMASVRGYTLTPDPGYAYGGYHFHDAVELLGDYTPAGFDPDVDGIAQKNILAGPVYNRNDLTGSIWEGGADPYTTWRWGIVSYSTTYSTVLVSPGYWDNTDWSTQEWTQGWYSGYDPVSDSYFNRRSTPRSWNDPSTWNSWWTYMITDASITPTWHDPTYRTVATTTPNYGWIPTNHAGVAPQCRGGQWKEIPYIQGVITVLENDPLDIYLWPGATRVSIPPVATIIPSSWTNLGALSSSVAPGTYQQVKGQYNIQVVGIPFPYAVSGQTYTGAPIVKTVTAWSPPDPRTGVQFFVTLVATVGLTGVKWNWGDGTQSIYSGAQGLGACTPAPFCGPTRTPTHVGNGHVNVWEYYGSDIWEYYYDPVQGGVVSKDLGSGTSGYLGCPSDPNPSSRPGGSSFCLTPTPAAPGTPQPPGGPFSPNNGYPYSVGQVEGLPTS